MNLSRHNMQQNPNLYVESWDLSFHSESIFLTQHSSLLLVDNCNNPLDFLNQKGKFFIHSTSWRYEQDKGVILTFVTLDREATASSIRVADYLNSKSNDFNILKHAIRHLSFLTYYDSNFFLLLKEKERYLLREFEPLPAGMI